MLIDVLSDGWQSQIGGNLIDMFPRFVRRTRIVAGNRDIADIPYVPNAFRRTEVGAKHQASETAEKTGGQFKLTILILGTIGDVIQNR